MGFWANLFGAGETIKAGGDVIEKTGKALDSIFTSDDERLSHAEVMQRIRQEPSQWQHQLNLINAADAKLWNSGWRPALGWIGAVSLALFFIPQYVSASFIWGAACYELITSVDQLVIQHDGRAQLAFALPAYPVDAQGLMELVILLIGGVAIRSIDKANGTARS